MLGRCQLLAEGAAHARVRPELMRGLARLLLVLGVADVKLAVARLVLTEGLHQILVGGDRDQGVSGPTGELRGVWLRSGDGDLGRLVRKREDPGLLDGVVLAAVALVAALPEEAHDLDRLLEHLQPRLRPRPARARDVLVQLLAGADAEEEAAVHHGRARRGRLGADRRGDADRGARDASAEPDPLRCFGDAADHAPDEGALALRVDPRMVVVGD